MKTEKLIREFTYNGAKLIDPAPALTVQQVRDFYANTYPELTTAEIEGPEIKGARHTYIFRRAVGTKGASDAAQRMITDRLDAIAAHPDLPAAVEQYVGSLICASVAHIHALLPEEIAFVDALYARFGARDAG